MKVIKVQIKTSEKPVQVLDFDIDGGYRQGAGGSLP